MGKKKLNKSKKLNLKLKRKRKRSSSRSTTSSSSTESLSSVDEELKKKLKKKLKKLKKKEKQKKKEKKALKKLMKSKTKDLTLLTKGITEPSTSLENDIALKKSKILAPMTKEEWELQQNTLKRVYDEATKRTRLVKGTGEIVEECVSRERHLAINKQATRGDGEYFQKKLLQQLK